MVAAVRVVRIGNIVCRLRVLSWKSTDGEGVIAYFWECGMGGWSAALTINFQTSREAYVSVFKTP